MSGFLEREVKNKLKFWVRIRDMEWGRWAKQMQEVKRGMGIRTSWDRRNEFAARCVGYNKKQWEERNIGDREISGLVYEAFEGAWKERMNGKSSLRVYREEKGTRGHVEGIYSNGVGSGLLADARAGVLDTRVMRGKFEEVDEACRMCGGQRETIEHVVLECCCLGGRRAIGLTIALGLKGNDSGEIESTKVRLSLWRKSR